MHKAISLPLALLILLALLSGCTPAQTPLATVAPRITRNIGDMKTSEPMVEPEEIKDETPRVEDVFTGDDELMTDVGTPRRETLIVESTSGTMAKPGQFNPYIPGTDVNFGIGQLLYSQLWEIDAIKGEQYPAIAAEMPRALNDDFTSFEVKIREGLAWSDGEPLTAKDAVFTFTMLLSNANLTRSGFMNTYIKSVELVDEYTFIINTHKPLPRIAQMLGVTSQGNSSAYILPEHVWKDIDPTKFKNEIPVSSGPYTIKKYDELGNWVLYERRDDWAKTDVGILGGEPKAKYVLFRFFDSEEKRIMAMINNEVDLLCEISPESWEALQLQQPNVRMWESAYPYAVFDDPSFYGIAINSALQPFDNPDFRWALALALDIREIASSQFGGMVRTASLQIPPALSLNETYYKPMEQWLRNFETSTGFKPYNENYAAELSAELAGQGIHLPADAEERKVLFGRGWWKHDDNEAEKLLMKAGLEKVDGKWMYEGKPFQLTLNIPDGFEAAAGRTAEAILEQWVRFGLDVVPLRQQSSDFINAIAMGDFQVSASWQNYGMLDDAYNALNGWHTKLLKPVGERNVGQASRWQGEGAQRASEILDKLEPLPWADTQIVPLMTDLLKEFVTELPFLPVFGSAKFVPVNETYWMGYPTAENAYNGPWWWWSTFKYMTPYIQPK